VKKPKDEALEVEKAIKVAVTMEAGDIVPKGKGSESEDYMKSPITGAGIMNQMKQAHSDPVGNKLNAASAAGIEMARQTLSDSMYKKAAHWDWHSGPKIPLGLSSTGLLGDDETDLQF
jgi:hypothetical protein